MKRWKVTLCKRQWQTRRPPAAELKVGKNGEPKGRELREVRPEKPSNMYWLCAICHRRRHRHPGTTVRMVRRRGEGERAARGFVFPLGLRPLLKGTALGHARRCAGAEYGRRGWREVTRSLYRHRFCWEVTCGSGWVPLKLTSRREWGISMLASRGLLERII